jgi:hypothetical protein
VTSIRFAAVLGLLVLFSASAQAAQVCAWMVESEEPDDQRVLTIWLQSDQDLHFLYKVGGKGIISGTDRMNSPGSGTFILKSGKADKPWTFGATLEPPGRIDVSMELHEMPAMVTSDAPTPVLAKFAFDRDVPATEGKPPATLAKKQCATVPTH